jgi:hypothetical protein
MRDPRTLNHSTGARVVSAAFSWSLSSALRSRQLNLAANREAVQSGAVSRVELPSLAGRQDAPPCFPAINLNVNDGLDGHSQGAYRARM